MQILSYFIKFLMFGIKSECQIILEILISQLQSCFHWILYLKMLIHKCLFGYNSEQIFLVQENVQWLPKITVSCLLKFTRTVLTVDWFTYLGFSLYLF